MSQIILDMGSGNTCQNNWDIAKKMIDTVAEIDTHKHEVIFKYQLFEKAEPNIPLYRDIFARAYTYTESLGYQTTSSVFDIHALNYLLMWDIPFVKIPCRPELYWLIGEIPRKYMVYVSIENLIYYELYQNYFIGARDVEMACVPKYPAKIDEYEEMFDTELGEAISDHVKGLSLWYIFEPEIWEKHFCLEHDDKNPDAGDFAITPEELKEIL